MDLKALKLELIERIALLDDDARLLALKRVLDAPRSYDPANEHLSVVREGRAPYGGMTTLRYSWPEVLALLEADRSVRPDGDGISDEDLAELDARHQARVSGESQGLSMEESLARLRR